MKANQPHTRVPDDKLHAVCKIGQIECCRYLTVGGAGFACEKHTSLRSLLDARVADGKMRAIGDNCEGITPGFGQ